MQIQAHANLLNTEVSTDVTDYTSYWKYDGGSGSDEKGTHNATLYNSPTQVNGHSGGANKAIYLDGVNQYTEYGTNVLTTTESACTFTSWIYMISSKWGFIFGRYDNTVQTTDRTIMEVVSDGSLRLRIASGGAAADYKQFVTAAGVINLNTWYYVAFTANLATDTLKIYVNDNSIAGTFTSSGTFTTFPASAMPFRTGTIIAGSPGSPTYYYSNMRIDNFRLYKRALDTTEIGKVKSNT